MLATAAAVGAAASGAVTVLVPTGAGSTVGAPVAEGRTAVAAVAAVAVRTGPAGATVATGPATASGPSAGPGGSGPLVPVVQGVEDDAGATVGDDQLALLDKAAVLADELAAVHARQAREQAERDRIRSVVERGGLDGWIAEALTVLDLPQSLAPSVEKIVMAESGGNPRAINRWDSNARRGTPSQGLMQTIPGTFRAYVHPDLADESITHPVANLTAGIRYMIDNYGMDTLEAGGRSNSSGAYIGY